MMTCTSLMSGSASSGTRCMRPHARDNEQDGAGENEEWIARAPRNDS